MLPSDPSPAGEAVVDNIVAILPPLLQTLEALAFIARYMHPPAFGAVMERAGTPDRTLQAERSRLAHWPETFNDIRTPLEAACDTALAGFTGLRDIAAGNGDFRDVIRAMRNLPRAEEALYPLAARLPPVSQFFLDSDRREDARQLARFAKPVHPGTGVSHHDGPPGARGGYSLYVPEDYTPGRRWPLVMALHGGSGSGRSFLWNWLRDARGHGAILVAPTATGSTWTLMGDDNDTPRLQRILDSVRAKWMIDPARLLLTGISDGGTFCYVSGLERTSPFTHLAPVAATFHPLMAEMADAERLRGLPVYQVHGKLDWMFPIEVARQANDALSAAGADTRLREIDDLSHSYPREINADILAWLQDATA
jgi:phospholipase/carboxylesterase